MRTEVVGEIYAAQRKFDRAHGRAPPPASYIQSLEKAGAEIATRMKLSETTESRLGLDFFAPNV